MVTIDITNKKILIYGVVLLVIVFIGGYLFGSRSTDNNGPTNNIKTELGNIERENREAGRHIDSASEGIIRSRDEIRSVSDGIGTVQEGLRENSDTVRDVRGRIGSSQGEFEEIRRILDENERIYNAID